MLKSRLKFPGESALIRSLALRLLLLATLGVGAVAALAQSGKPQVPIFVLHSYSQEYPWTRGQHQGFMAALDADKGRSYDVRFEYLDTKRAGYGSEPEIDFPLFMKFCGCINNNLWSASPFPWSTGPGLDGVTNWHCPVIEKFGGLTHPNQATLAKFTIHVPDFQTSSPSSRLKCSVLYAHAALTMGDYLFRVYGPGGSVSTTPSSLTSAGNYLALATFSAIPFTPDESNDF